MPSVSTAQHGFMGLVHAVKNGDRKIADLRPGMRKKVERAASSMTKDQISEYTRTRTEGLPRHAPGTQPAGGKSRAARSA